MGGPDKLLEEAGGEPLLARVVARAAAAGARVIVALPQADIARRGALAGIGIGGAVEIVPVADPGEGMAASLRAGARRAGPGPLMIALADMPDLDTSDYARLLAAFREDPATPLRAAAEDGTPGHPVILPTALAAGLAALKGDRGARGLIGPGPVRIMPLPGRRALTDLDTPEDWDAWRASAGT